MSRVVRSSSVFFIFIFALSLLGSSLAFAGPGAYPGRASQPRASRFTENEKNFLRLISGRAQEIVNESITTTREQLEFIQSNGEYKAMTLNAVKSAYAQYKTYLFMSEDRFGTAAQPEPAYLREHTFPFNDNDYSPYQFYLTSQDRERHRQMALEDRAFLVKNYERCRLHVRSMTNHYKKQLGEILALAPVVLQINAVGAIPTDQEVIEGYQELLANMGETLQSFQNHNLNNDDEAEGLWAYQGIAQELVEENPRLTNFSESLRLKIEPQGLFQKAVAYIKGILPALAPLACTIAAIATANPVLAIACSALNLYIAVNNVRADYVRIRSTRNSWLSGISSFQDIELANRQLVIDYVLFAFNLYAGSTVLRSTNHRLLFDWRWHRNNLGSTLNFRTIRAEAKKYTEDYLRGEGEGQVKNHLTLGMASLQQPDNVVSELSQQSTQVLIAYLRKGMFTFKDTAQALCSTPRPASP